MPTPSKRLNLSLPTQPDDFDTSDLRNNWEKIDAAPGVHICTSSTRPGWGANQIGRLIYETNTDLEWRWNGTQFVRVGGKGLLRKPNGTFASDNYVSITGLMDNGLNPIDGKTATVGGTQVITQITAVVPPGGRPLRFAVDAPTFAVSRSGTGIAVTSQWHSAGQYLSVDGTAPANRITSLATAIPTTSSQGILALFTSSGLVGTIPGGLGAGEHTFYAVFTYQPIHPTNTAMATLLYGGNVSVTEL